jgi:hypothetical protein
MVGSDLRIAGKPADAVVHLEQATVMLEGSGHLWVGLSRAELGQCYLLQMWLREAVSVFEECNACVTTHGVRGHNCGPVRNGLAEAYMMSAEHVSRNERVELLDKATRACGIAIQRSKRDCESVPGAYRLQGTYEWLMDRPNRAREWWKRRIDAGEELGTRYEVALAHLEICNRAADAPHHAIADALFSEIGAEPTEK